MPCFSTPFEEDIQEIRELQRCYVNGLIFCDRDGCTKCFAESAKVDVYLHKPAQDKESIRTCFKEKLSKIHAGKEGHFVVHPIIRVDGEKATGGWLIYLMYCYPRTGQSLFWVQLYYNNEYLRQKGEWKISLMTCWERMGLTGGGLFTDFF